MKLAGRKRRGCSEIPCWARTGFSSSSAASMPSVTASVLATLSEISGGRMDLGIGRGDSARRVLGKTPTTMKDLEEAVHVIRALAEGRQVEFEGTMLELPWSSGHRLPVWIAGYGPVALMPSSFMKLVLTPFCRPEPRLSRKMAAARRNKLRLQILSSPGTVVLP